MPPSPATKAAVKEDPLEINENFFMLELNVAILSTKPKPAGRDEILPSMLKHLGVNGKRALLTLINRSWSEIRVPTAWKHAVIIPILTRKKPATVIKSYRQVALLSCVSKLMERMVCSRLKELVKENDVIPLHQAGFQENRRTQDVLVDICQRAMDNLQQKNRTLVVAVNFKAFFDKIWKSHLLRDLAIYGLSGRSLRLIRNWLSDRTAVVRLNHTLSPPNRALQAETQIERRRKSPKLLEDNWKKEIPYGPRR